MSYPAVYKVVFPYLFSVRGVIPLRQVESGPTGDILFTHWGSTGPGFRLGSCDFGVLPLSSRLRSLTLTCVKKCLPQSYSSRPLVSCVVSRSEGILGEVKERKGVFESGGPFEEMRSSETQGGTQRRRVRGEVQLGREGEVEGV